jgi:hypothetical protein
MADAEGCEFSEGKDLFSYFKPKISNVKMASSESAFELLNFAQGVGLKYWISARRGIPWYSLAG